MSNVIYRQLSSVIVSYRQLSSVIVSYRQLLSLIVIFGHLQYKFGMGINGINGNKVVEMEKSSCIKVNKVLEYNLINLSSTVNPSLHSNLIHLISWIEVTSKQ